MMPRSDVLALTFGLVSTVIGIFTILITLLVMHCRRARSPYVHEDQELTLVNSNPSTPPQPDTETALMAIPNHHHAAAQENGQIYHAIGELSKLSLVSFETTIESWLGLGEADCCSVEFKEM